MKYIKILFKLNVLYKSKCIKCSLLIKYIRNIYIRFGNRNIIRIVLKRISNVAIYK
jgi:hypothetical protein